MTGRRLAALAAAVAGCGLAAAVVVRDALADIGHAVHDAWRAPRSARSADELLAGWPDLERPR